MLLILLLFGLTGVRSELFSSKTHGFSRETGRFPNPQKTKGSSTSFIPSAAPETVDLFDLTPFYNMDRADFYENTHFVSALQGLVNRNQSQLFVFFTSEDAVWLQYLTSPGVWLQNTTFNNITSIADLVSKYQTLGYFPNGAVVYDSNVTASSLLASTSSGAENLLPINNRTDATSPTLYQQFIETGILKIGRYISSSMFTGNITGSRKGDAYIWAIQEFIVSGLCDPSFQGYYIDYFWVLSSPCCGGGQTDYQMATLTNHDFFIARRGFFWDLDVWPNQVANDDPTQPPGTDLKVLQQLLLASYERVTTMIHVGGFTPWAYKYVSPFGEYGGVQTEWQTVSVLSGYNAFVDGDACCIGAMANAAFFQHFTLEERYLPNPMPLQQDLIDKGYLTTNGTTVASLAYSFWYAGDYDSAAWLYGMLKARWDDPDRGTIPIGWAVDSELSLRFPVIYKYLYDTRGPNDFFISGDSGAGYLNPQGLFEPRYSNLSSGADVWTNWNTNWYRKFGLSFSGFLINGYNQMENNAKLSYMSYSPHGIVGQQDMVPPSTELLNNSLPVMHEASDIVNVDVSTAVQEMCSYVEGNKPQFLMFRTILEYPNFMMQVTQQIPSSCPNLVIVDPHVAGFLARIYLGGNNDNIVTYMNDTFPRIATSSTVAQTTFFLRNEGWNILTVGQYSLNVTLTSSTGQIEWNTAVELFNNVQPGSIWSLSANFNIPSQSGVYSLAYSMQSSNGEPFQSLGYQVAVAVF